ncbi:PREDICTED: cilia- and flagella-associated protein 52-like [Crocodylus porosus]|uniref:cilia- and flagella-associated protein 52-like n=1 Tax=Crocodylus porosus TaxID=8502 RepID=UPI00093D096E|nr:PREDICTED: cilia- and flagella-associated protein 52-like [Crocodylus porosus]
MGFKADIILWDYEKKELLARLSLHKGKVEKLAFSPNDLYLVSLGGQDDGNGTIRVWELDLPDRKIRSTECQTGQLKRVITCIMRLTALLLLKTGDLVFGTGGGIVAPFKGSNHKSIKKIQVQGGVTSWTLRGQGHQFFAGTEESQIYRINFTEFKEECIATCHNKAINDIIFPPIWQTRFFRRLIRNQMILANTLFQCVCYHPEEFQIITSGTDRNIGWWEVFDGSVIRELEGSVKGSINGMDITSDGTHFVTGGDDHLVKVWDYDTGEVTHVGVGHSGSIRRLKICPGNKYIVSVSADGAILRWKHPHSH